MFCDEHPPLHMRRTDLRRRWQALHLAMHIKRGDVVEEMATHEGDLGRK
jgi:hypothetical protein